MKKAIFAVLVMTLLFSCKEQVKTEAGKSNKKAKAHTENPISLSGKNLEYNYGAYIYVLNFESDTKLHWKCIKGDKTEQGREADQIYSTQRLNNNTFFIAWVESDGLGVSQVVNLKKNMIHTFLKDGKEISILKGTITEL